MPDHEYILVQDPPEYLLDELRKRGFDVTKAYLGIFGYTTDYQTDLVCHAINNLMRNTTDWTPIEWDELTPCVRRTFMYMAADSDEFMEKARLPTGFSYEEQINCVLDKSHDHIVPCHKQQSTEDQAPPHSKPPPHSAPAPN